MYDPKITARKAARAAGDTTTGAAFLFAPLAMLVPLAWWILDLHGIHVPDQVRQAITPERLVLVAGTIMLSPAWSAIGRAWRNWRRNRMKGRP